MNQKGKKLRPSSQFTVRELIQEGYETLVGSHKKNPKIDAQLLALHVLGFTKLQGILNANQVVSKEDERKYRDFISKRCNHIPLQYIINEQEFMGLPFYVDENVLIPRQDTETLVEKLIEKYKERPFKTMIEIGVGSGCISISLAKYLPKVQITGIDISQKALEIARKNAKQNNVEGRIHWIDGDLLNDYKTDEKVDLIVSNPPYITTKDCGELEKDVRKHEPMLALDGGEDGLVFYRKITRQAKRHLTKGGMLAYEIGYNQSRDVSAIMKENGFKEIEIIKDLANKDRIVLGILGE